MTERVLTVTTAAVGPESAAAVTDAYREVTAKLPHSVMHTVLVRGEADEWQIITLWRSREQLAEYRREVDVPAAIKIFRDAGAEPQVAVFDVLHEAASA